MHNGEESQETGDDAGKETQKILIHKKTTRRKKSSKYPETMAMKANSQKASEDIREQRGISLT